MLNNVASSESTVANFLKSVNASKGVGPDGIPPVFIKMTCEHLTMPIKILFNTSIDTTIFLSTWKTNDVVPLHKKGDKRTIKNYRSIYILTTI